MSNIKLAQERIRLWRHDPVRFVIDNFKAEPDEHGNERWDIYAAEPASKGDRP